jgi:hypothetical protein
LLEIALEHGIRRLLPVSRPEPCPQAHEKTKADPKWNNKTVSFTFVFFVPPSIAFSLEFALNQAANTEKLARSYIEEDRLQ